MTRRKKSRSSRNAAEADAGSPEQTSSTWDKIKTTVQTATTHFLARPWYYRVTAVVVLLALILLLRGGDSHSTINNNPQTQSAWRRGFSLRASSSSSFLTLVPGELPGYTGWARPATTLAKHFLLETSNVQQPATAGEIWDFTVQCSHKDCAQGGALFFVRAYGPSVVTGKVEDHKDGSYRIEILFKDPGPYTLEVVLAFSNPPSFGQFPLPADQPEPEYEGYLLPEFPLPLEVVPNPDPEKDYTYTKSKTLPVCEMKELLETSPSSAWEKARWVVTGKVNAPNHVDDHAREGVTFAGYRDSYNSLGIQMEYHHDHCRLLPPVAPQHPANPLNQCVDAKGPLHFLFIGDSNMRLQRDLFQHAFLGIPENPEHPDNRGGHSVGEHNEQHTMRASYMDLTGGALKSNFEGEDKNVTRFFQMLKAREDKALAQRERYVVLFNTGMHDIHRLCSHEFANDRLTYLGPTATDATKGFHCVMHYRYAVEGLAAEVLNFVDADLRLFQSTTAGWPKYGNYDVVWPPDGGQNMPVATEFIDFFNDIAYDVMKESFPTIPVIDGYWVSYARPDNREVSLGRKKALEKKLSHPGNEVVMTLLRTLVTVVAQSDLCKK